MALGEDVRIRTSAVVSGARSRFTRRRWRGRLGRWRTALLLGVGCVAAVGVGWLFWASDLLSVDEVRVEGTHLLVPDRVERAAGVADGTPLARVNLAEVEDRVAALAPVAAVDVRRDWPGTLRVVVSERTAVAVLAESGTYHALDGEGVLFRRWSRPPPGLPMVDGDALARATTGATGTAGTAGATGTAGADALRAVASVVQSLEPAVARRVDHVEVASLDAIALALRDGARVQWGSAEDSALKGEVLTALMQVPAGTYDVSVPQAPTTSGVPPG